METVTLKCRIKRSTKWKASPKNQWWKWAISIYLRANRFLISLEILNKIVICKTVQGDQEIRSKIKYEGSNQIEWNLESPGLSSDIYIPVDRPEHLAQNVFSIKKIDSLDQKLWQKNQNLTDFLLFLKKNSKLINKEQ